MQQLETKDQKVADYICNEFIPADNIPVSSEFSSKIVANEKASLLAEQEIISGTLEPKLKKPSFEDGKLIFTLKEPITYTCPNNDGSVTTFVFRKYFIDLSRKSKKRFGLTMDELLNHIDGDKGHYHTHGNFGIKHKASGTFIESKVVRACVEKTFYEQNSLWDCLEPISRFPTAEAYCATFSADDTFSIYGETTKQPKSVFMVGFEDWEDEGELEIIAESGREEVDSLEFFFKETFCHRIRTRTLTRVLSKIYDLWNCLLTSFKNIHEEIDMVLLKLYDYDNMTKEYLPVTSWRRKGYSSNELFFIPPFKGQNLWVGNKAPNTDITIICDSPEIAYTNHAQFSGIKWISYVCDKGQYSQVDFSKEINVNDDVYQLITNHSGIPLPEKVIEHSVLRKHLKDVYEIDTKPLLVEVNYPPPFVKPIFHSVEDVMNLYRDNKPTVRHESVRVLADDEFVEIVQKADSFLNSRPVSFWEVADVEAVQKEQTIPELEEPIAKPKESQDILRPLITRAELSLLLAQRSVGKTNLMYALAGYIISNCNHSFIGGKAFNKPVNHRSKVLLLTFENNTAADISGKIKSFVLPYLSPEKVKRDQALELLQVEALSWDLSDVSTHQSVLDLIGQFQDKGDVRDIGLVVFDTCRAALGDNVTDAKWATFLKLNKRIHEAFNCATLGLAHTDRTGNMEGFKGKENGVGSIFSLTRESQQQTLEDPMTFKVTKPRRVISKTDISSFELLRHPLHKRFTSITSVAVDSEGSKKESKRELKDAEKKALGTELSSLLKDYTKELTADESYSLLGYKSSTFYNQIPDELKKKKRRKK